MAEAASGDKHLRPIAELHQEYQREDPGLVLISISFSYFYQVEHYPTSVRQYEVVFTLNLVP